MHASNYRRACHECQSRHLKCDLRKPCTQCIRASRPCVEPRRYQFRHHASSNRTEHRSDQFKSNQKWAKIPKRLVFTSEPISALPTTEFSVLETEPLYELNSQTYHSSYPTHDGPHTLTSPFSSRDLNDSPAAKSSSSWSETPHSLEIPSTLWPLCLREEATLLKHFATVLSVWFDFCDRQRHFATIVVPAAATSPILHNAIMAVSAKHLSLTRNVDSQTPDKYQQECLKLLIPALVAEDSFLDDKLFAATLLLRFFNEMTEPIDEPDLSAHVLGSHTLMSAREKARVNCDTTTASSLRSATLNTELRQEIHIGFLTNRAPPASLMRYCNTDRSLDPASDWTWTWRAIALTADVLAYCNGEDNPKTPTIWRDYWNSLDAMKEHLPPSFTPIYEESVCPENGKVVPDIWFTNDCHAAAHQYLSLARIILLAHDPNVSPLGLERNDLLRQIDSQIKHEVTRICGIACSNRHITPVLFCAGIAIAMCGDRFTNRNEQDLFIEILEEMEVTLAWPRLRASDRLKKSWGYAEIG